MADLPKNILVVDDELGVREALTMLLKYDGHQVTTAEDAQVALNKFQPLLFDLVITDFTMPGMKGDELALALKKIDPGIPIVLLTAFPPPSHPPGIELIITKPFY